MAPVAGVIENADMQERIAMDNGVRIELTIPAELAAQLARIAEASGMRDAAEAAIVGLAEWVSGRQAALDNRDPAQKYFVNEALDELMDRRK